MGPLPTDIFFCKRLLLNSVDLRSELSMTLVVYACYDSILEINFMRQVLVGYYWRGEKVISWKPSCGIWQAIFFAAFLPRTNCPWSYKLRLKKLAYFISNTYPRHKPSKHWISMTLEESRDATFYDPYDFSLFFYYPKTFLEFMETQASDRAILYHEKQLQHPLSTYCIQHCVYYLSNRPLGLSYEKTLLLYHHNVVKNVKMVRNFVVRKLFRLCIFYFD